MNEYTYSDLLEVMQLTTDEFLNWFSALSDENKREYKKAVNEMCGDDNSGKNGIY